MKSSFSALQASRASSGTLYSAGMAARQTLNPRRDVLERLVRQRKPWAMTPMSRRLGRSPPIPAIPDRKNWREFEEARDFTRRLGFRSQEEWKDWCRNIFDSPDDVPADPERVYEDSWQGWDDWLGTNLPEQGPPYRDFPDAREYARSLGFENKRAWATWAMQSPERPLDVPFLPNIVYEDEGWEGWNDFLGSCPVVEEDHGSWLSYDRAQLYALSWGLNSEDEWNEWAANAELPVGIPKNPKDAYEGAGWKDWEAFLSSSDDEQDDPPKQHTEN